MKQFIFPQRKLMKLRWWWLLGGWILWPAWLWSAPLAEDTLAFPRPEMTKIQVYFWKKVFSEISISEGLLHDRETLLPIYVKVPLAGLNKEEVTQTIEAYKTEVQQQIELLAQALETQTPLSPAQRNLLNSFYRGITPEQLRQAAKRLRFQYGMAERFRESVVRSGTYLPYIRRVLRQYGLPEALGYLPHVESSFNWQAVSKSEAKGIWQFTHRTGLEYMQINEAIDERLDPFRATEAAAQLLKKNYEVLQSWPLALTAYNHGRAGVLKVINEVGSRDLGELVRRYTSETFDFASKNFYAEFLAAWDVAANAEYYFGPLEHAPPLEFRFVQIPRPTSFQQILKQLPYSREEILALNPALLPPVLENQRLIPAEYSLKVPLTSHSFPLAQTFRTPAPQQPFLAEANQATTRPRSSGTQKVNTGAVSPSASKAIINVRLADVPNKTSKSPALNEIIRYSTKIMVKAGDSLRSLAKQFKVDPLQLAEINALSLDARLYSGQILFIPPSAPLATETSNTKPTPPIDSKTPNLMDLRKLSSLHPSSKNNGKNQRIVIVQPGDTLVMIARRTGISVAQLREHNGLTQDAKIYPGQSLVLKM